MTELRGGDYGAHYSTDDRFHCATCGIGLMPSERCSICKPAAGRSGSTMTGAQALASLLDTPVMRKIQAETEQRAMYEPLDDADTWQRWVEEHPTGHGRG
jgi:hypothetical protein